MVSVAHLSVRASWQPHVSLWAAILEAQVPPLHPAPHRTFNTCHLGEDVVPRQQSLFQLKGKTPLLTFTRQISYFKHFRQKRFVTYHQSMEAKHSSSSLPHDINELEKYIPNNGITNVQTLGTHPLRPKSPSTAAVRLGFSYPQLPKVKTQGISICILAELSKL